MSGCYTFRMLRVLLITALLTLPLGVPAHEPLWLPPTPWGVNPCDLPRVRCPLALRSIHENLIQAQQYGDKQGIDHWHRRLRTWYAFNPDYRRHLHPHSR